MGDAAAALRLLAGYRVLELGDPAAMFAGKLLGDMGCEVLRVEPPSGDPWREQAPCVPWGGAQRSALWVAYNTSKRCVTLDVAAVEGRALLDRLIDAADILIASGPAEWLEALRLRPADVRTGRRKLVALTISPFGLTGPLRDYRASDLVLQAAGGMLYLNGNEDRPPVRISEETCWAQAGAQAAFAASAALNSAQRDGVGEGIDLSVQEAITDALVDALPWWQHSRRHKRRRTHSGYGDVTIPTIWPCQDGYVCFRLSFGKGLGKRNQRLLGWMAEEGMDDGLREVPWESISTITLAQSDADGYVRRIERFFRTKTRTELYAGARARHIILFPVTELSDVPLDRQMRERGFFVELSDPLGRPAVFPGALFRSWGAEEAGPAPAAPDTGHSAAVLAELAGVDAARFAQLRADGVVA
jgi:crotonobetainyl-CoA:carnitine CoA-transferase CaiB-like acyl-CoA transferase